MSTQTVSQTSTMLRQIIVRYRWIGALGLLTVVVALVGYGFTGMPAAPSRAADRAQVSLVEPAAPSVLDYLRVHSIVQPLSTPAVSVDPAQRSVVEYIRAHESVEQPSAPWDPAVQAVLEYLRAHSQ